VVVADLRGADDGRSRARAKTLTDKDDSMKKLLTGALALALILGVLAAAFGDRVLMRAMQRQVEHNLSGAAFAEFPDGLNVVLCGAGSPMPDPTRTGPCVAIVAGQRVVVVDAGSGSVRNLPLYGIPVGRVSDVFITHFHSDHIDGLGELMMQRWANAAHTEPLPVHGPDGIEQVVDGFNRAYAADDTYRIAHHGPKIIPPSGAGGIAKPFALPAPGEGTVVLDDGGLKVTAFTVDHRPIVPAVGYRFDYHGRSVLVSGDTVKSANLEHFAQGVDLLVHEALAPQLVNVITQGATAAGAGNIAQITRDILNYHTTPVEAAQIAQAAGAKYLLLYHIVPALPYRPLERLFLRGVSDAYAGPAKVGRNGTWISLPAGTTEVKAGQR
jgi:ribonuclease Z